MKTLAIIFARMDSTRLPGKVLKPICGVPLLTRLLNRVRRARFPDDVMLATTARKVDDELVEWARENDVPFYRGSVDNVLLRCIKAARSWGDPDIIVRVCGDTPLIDPTMIDVFVSMMDRYRMARSINTGRKFPQGTTAHVCYLEDLKNIYRNSADPVLREHVTLGLYEDGPFKVPTFEMEGTDFWYCAPTRLQVDYPEDLQLVREIQKRLGPGDDFGIQDIVNLLKETPSLRMINAHCKEKEVR